jgi:hypothetical protein
MSRKHHHRHHDTNALVLGNGVSFAVLESMFNLVQTQSVLSASMVKNQDLSQILAIDTLARSLSEIMNANARCGRGASDANSKKTGDPDTGSRSFAIAPGGNVSDILSSNPGQGPGQGGASSNALEIELLHEMIEMMSDITKELTDVVRESSNGKLMVY